jgi:hypothetical protein
MNAHKGVRHEPSFCAGIAASIKAAQIKGSSNLHGCTTTQHLKSYRVFNLQSSRARDRKLCNMTGARSKNRKSCRGPSRLANRTSRSTPGSCIRNWVSDRVRPIVSDWAMLNECQVVGVRRWRVNGRNVSGAQTLTGARAVLQLRGEAVL